MGKRKNDAGLVASNFPLPDRWKFDQDYLDKLSTEERQWLAAFMDAYVGGDFRGVPREQWPLPNRSDVNRSKDAGKVDAFGLTAAGLWGAEGLANMDELAEVLASPPLPEAPPSAAYLEDPEYKAARDEFRRHLHPGHEPKITPEYEKAARRLRKLSPPREQEAVPAVAPAKRTAAGRRRSAHRKG